MFPFSASIHDLSHQSNTRIMGDQEELATLRQEVIRLTQELDQTSSEKIQSAQYGLVLLEEKENLEARCQVCYELENAKVCVSNYLNGIV